MGTDFTCPHCRSEIEADETVGGSHAQCPRCSGIVLIPRFGIQVGTTVGGYRIARKLGVGGMGEVWLAEQTAMGRAVALKILSPAMTADPEFVQRFVHEVQTVAKLEHPNIATAFDAGNDGDIHYLAVSYVDGDQVGNLLKRDKVVPEKDALPIVRGVAEALKYAWDKFRMLHRDIKPANIMLTSDGVPKLMDMGISKTMAEDVQLTMAGHIVGTPHYMSPEQARADSGIDFRADIYSLGATLYHMVTGTLPFGGKTAMAVLTRHITEPLESPRKRNPGVTQGCSALIEAMMAKDPVDRPGSWEDVLQDIDRVLKGLMPASRRPPTGQSVVTRMTPEELRTLRTGHHAKVSAHDLHQALRKPAPAPVRKSSAKPALITVAVLAVVAGIGLLMALAGRRAGPSHPSRPARRPAAVPAAVRARTPAPAVNTDRTTKMWEEALRYARANPGQHEQVIAHFRAVKTRAAGTRYEALADAEIRRLEHADWGPRGLGSSL